MTNAELIKALRICANQTCCDNCPRYDIDHTQDAQRCCIQLINDAAAALEAAEAALEKQIPKRAVGTHYANMRCPSCGKRIPSGQGSSSRRRDNWCNYCGQKIDWSNGKDGADDGKS